MQGVEIKIGNVPRVYPLIHESILFDIWIVDCITCFI